MDKVIILLEKILPTLIWLFFIFFILHKRKWVIEILESIFKQASKFSGINLTILGQKISLDSAGTFEKSSNTLEIKVDKIIPKKNFSGAIPYVSFREIEKTVYKIEALEVFGFKPKEIEDRSILNILGSYHFLKADFRVAKEYYEKVVCLEENKKNDLAADALSNLGWVNLKIGSFDDAIANFNDGVNKKPILPWAYMGRAIVHDKLNDDSKCTRDRNTAMSQFAMILKKQPHDYLAHIGIARAYRMSKKYIKAVESLTAAVQLKPEIALAYYNRAALRINHPEIFKNEQQEAILDLLLAIMRNPTLRRYVEKDPDFQNIRNLKCYRCLINQEPVAEAA